MTTIAEIQDAVRALPERQLEAFSSWFDQYESTNYSQTNHCTLRGSAHKLEGKVFSTECEL